jgi:hypothetical protein
VVNIARGGSISVLHPAAIAASLLSLNIGVKLMHIRLYLPYQIKFVVKAKTTSRTIVVPRLLSHHPYLFIARPHSPLTQAHIQQWRFHPCPKTRMSRAAYTLQQAFLAYHEVTWSRVCSDIFNSDGITGAAIATLDDAAKTNRPSG